MKDYRVIVTGSSGYVGSNLIPEIKKDYEVIGNEIKRPMRKPIRIIIKVVFAFICPLLFNHLDGSSFISRCEPSFENNALNFDDLLSSFAPFFIFRYSNPLYQIASNTTC